MATKKQLEILELVKKYKSVREISRVSGYSRPYISSILKRNGIIPKQRKHCVDDSYFNVIDTPDKAYWLGFILADGTIARRAGQKYLKYLCVSLQRLDEKHLIMFKHALGYSGDIKHINRLDKRNNHISKQSSLTICSSSLCKSLYNIGWHEFKSKGDVKIFQYVPDKLVTHLMRGLFDGDGGFVIDKNNQIFLYFVDRFESVVSWFQEKLISIFDFNRTKIFKNKHKEVFKTQYRGNTQGVRLLSVFYSSISHPSLKRKQHKFMRFQIKNL